MLGVHLAYQELLGLSRKIPLPKTTSQGRQK